MNRADLHKLSRLRVKEAKILLSRRCYEGAYYLVGYAVECALKACFAKKTRRFEFPSKKLVNDVYVHRPDVLIKAVGLQEALKKEMTRSDTFADYWAIVKDWDAEKRYDTNVSDKLARDMFEAITDEKDGVLAWLKKWW